MASLDLKEAKSLADVFGELDRKKMLLLLLFDKAGSKWDKKKEIKELPKADRISTASLYRNVDELVGGGFLQVMKGSARRSRGGATVLTYHLTLKGYLAEAVNAQCLVLERRLSANLRKRVEKIVEDLKSSPGWPVYIEFLRWNRDRQIDLSRVNVDEAYFGSTLLLALLEHREDQIWKLIQPSANKTKELGLGLPEVTEKTVAELKNYHAGIQSFVDNFIAEVSKRSQGLKLQKKVAAT